MKKITPPNLIELSTIFTMYMVLLFSACGNQKNLAKNEALIEANPKIIFLNYSIKKMANNDVTLHFINQIVADGKLKKNKVLEGITGDLICAQLDKNNNILQTQIVKNPLIKNIEYIDDSKSFNNKQIELDSTQIAIRLQLEPNTKYISIYNFNTKNNKTKALITTAID